MNVVLNSRMVVTVTIRRKSDRAERGYDDDEEVYPSTVCNRLFYCHCFTLIFSIVCFVFIYSLLTEFTIIWCTRICGYSSKLSVKRPIYFSNKINYIEQRMVSWRSGGSLVSINEVKLRRARLVLGWVTVSGFNSRRRTFISIM